MRRAQGRDRAHPAHLLVPRQGLACQGPATACQGRQACPKRRGAPLTGRRGDHAVPWRPPAERLHTGRGAVDQAPGGRAPAPSLIALDDWREANVAPRTQPGPSTRTRAHGRTPGLPPGPDGGPHALGPDPPWPTCGPAPPPRGQPPAQGQVPRRADRAAQPPARLHPQGQRHPDAPALFLAPARIGGALAPGPWRLAHLRRHGGALPARPRPPSGAGARVAAAGRAQRWPRTAVGEAGPHEAHRLGGRPPAVQHRACRGAERLVARGAAAARVLLRVEAPMARTSLASGRARSLGAEDRCGVQEWPPDFAGEWGKRSMSGPPFSLQVKPHHGLVGSYPS